MRVSQSMELLKSLNWIRNFSCYWKPIKNIWSIHHICWKSFYFARKCAYSFIWSMLLWAWADHICSQFYFNTEQIVDFIYIHNELYQEQWNPLGCIFQWQQTWHRRLRNSMWQLSLIICLRSNVIKTHTKWQFVYTKAKNQVKKEQRRIEEKKKNSSAEKKIFQLNRPKWFAHANI